MSLIEPLSSERSDLYGWFPLCLSQLFSMYVSSLVRRCSQAAPAIEEPKEEAAPEPSEAKAEAVAEVKESAEASYVVELHIAALSNSVGELVACEFR